MPHQKSKSVNHSKNIRRQLKKQRELVENGKRLRVSSHPPEFVAIPWHEVTVRSQKAASSFNVFSLITLLRDQLHLSSNQGVDVRLRTVRIWGPLVPFTAGPLSSLRVRFHSLVPVTAPDTVPVPQYPLLRDIIDYPDQTRRAALGFEWPIAQQSVSLSTVATTNGPPIIEITEGNTDGLLVYFRLWWRPTSGLSVDRCVTDNVDQRRVQTSFVDTTLLSESIGSMSICTYPC